MVASLWALGSIAVIAILLIVIWSIRRHRNPKLEIGCNSPIDELIPSLAGITLSAPVHGNSVQLLQNGKFFDVIIERIAAAKHNVHFETFLWKKGELGRRLADAFIERARAGVNVRIMLDDTGSRNMGKEVLEQMRAAGCKVRM